MDKSVYTGYVVASDEQALALFDAYYEQPEVVLGGRDLDANVPVWPDSGRVPSLGQGDIPVVWDRLYTDERLCPHEPLGANVLHQDGHVTFIRYSYYNNSSYFPVTRLAAETFGSVLPRLSSDCYPF